MIGQTDWAITLPSAPPGPIDLRPHRLGRGLLLRTLPPPRTLQTTMDVHLRKKSFSQKLRGKMYSPPLQLLTASVLTIFVLIVSGALYHFRTLPPKYNLTNNAALSVLWILGLSFLTWNTGWTLRHRCLIENWKTEAGIMVCRLYKACSAFTVTGLYDPLTLRQI